MDNEYHIYIDSVLEDGTSINNIEFLEESVSVEDSDGNMKTFAYSEKVTVRVFERVYVESLLDILNVFSKKNIYMSRGADCEPSAIFNTFPDIPFKESLKEEDIPLDEIEDVLGVAFGQLKGSEKDITFKQVKKYIDSLE